MEPDLKLRDPQPIRLTQGGLGPGDTIAQGASASVLVEAEGLETLRVRAQVTGTTADLDVAPKLADKDADAATGLPTTVNLADGAEGMMDVSVVGEDLFLVTLSNTGAGPDATVAYVDVFPAFRSPK